MASAREPVHFLVFSASLRADSLNTRLARLVANLIERHAGTVDSAEMGEFDCPSYSQDAQSSSGIAPRAVELRSRLEANDAFVIVSPEYNSSMPGLLKNAIDWASRHKPQPFNGRHGLLLSASPSMVGAIAGSGRCASRSSIWVRACTPTCSPSGRRTRRSSRTGRSPIASWRAGSKRRCSRSWISSRRAKHYPCVKKAWIEFLGERPNPVIDRVE